MKLTYDQKYIIRYELMKSIDRLEQQQLHLGVHDKTQKQFYQNLIDTRQRIIRLMK